MKCDIHCQLTTAHLAIEAVHDAAAENSPPATTPFPSWKRRPRCWRNRSTVLHRGIECGALVDPWNILGFGGQYGLFPSPENSVYDHRIDELIAHRGQHFHRRRADPKGGRGSWQRADRRTGHAAAGCPGRLVGQIRYDRSHLGRELFRHANRAIRRTTCRPRCGRGMRPAPRRATLAFWRDRAEQFRTAKAYALVVDALLEQRSSVAAMALLVQWLSQADSNPAGRRGLFVPRSGPGLDAGPVGRRR